MSNIFKLCPTHFPGGAKNFLGGFAPLRPPGYGPDAVSGDKHHVDRVGATYACVLC